MLKENYRVVWPSVNPTTMQASILWREPDHAPLHHASLRKSKGTFLAQVDHCVSAYRDPMCDNDTSAASIRVLIVDPHVIVHAGLRSLLAEADDMLIVGEATHSADALHRAACLQPNVILIDPMLPEMDGIETIRLLRQHSATSQIVVLTAVGEEQWVHAALQAGAIGYLLKDVLQSELLRAIRAAAQGEPTLHPVAQRALMRKATASPFKDLTEREFDVLRLIVQGCNNRTIATTLCLTEGTVKGYVSTILAKLQVADRTQAALYAVKHGLSNN
jgi:DNA-binding NarL/FixJ family response regulator